MPVITKLPEDPDALVDIQCVLAVVPVSSRMTIWRWVKEKKFPPPIKLHNGRNYWRARRVRRWLKDQANK
jgi:predicted DNA-binding transcriptional regulator AlpA